MTAELVNMSTQPQEWSVSQARNRFSDAVNRAAFGGEITYITRGRNQQRAAAIVPADLVELYESLVDAQLVEIARQRREDLRTGRSSTVSLGDARRELGLE